MYTTFTAGALCITNCHLNDSFIQKDAVCVVMCHGSCSVSDGNTMYQKQTGWHLTGAHSGLAVMPDDIGTPIRGTEKECKHQSRDIP